MNTYLSNTSGSRNRGFIFAFLATLVGVAGAHAADKHMIRPQIRQGLSFGFVMTLDTRMESPPGPNGQAQQAVGVAKLEGSVTYKAVEGGVPTVAEVTVSDKSTVSQTLNGQKQDLPFALAGKKITISRGADGQITHDGGDAIDAATAESLKKLLAVDTMVYPNDAVVVGDEWSPDPAKIPPQMTMNGQGKVNLKCKLLKIGEVRSRPTYDISLGGTIIGQPQPGVEMNMTVGGVTQIDQATGLPAQADTVMKGTVAGPQGRAEIQMTVSATYTFAAAANGPAENVGPAPAPAAGPGPNPQPGNPLDPQPANPLDPRPQNPLAPERAAMPASPFQGIFKNEKVIAEFKVNGNNITGQLTLGARSFPLTGTIADGKATGEFEASGAKFNFVASINGETMDFNSEGNKYTLKKDAPARPKNPLEQ